MEYGASCGPFGTRPAPAFARCTIASSSQSDGRHLSMTPLERTEVHPRRWTLHGLNNGLLFRSTVRGVTTLPRAASYAIGHAGTWLAWQLMPKSNAALGHNLAALFPVETPSQLRRRALDTYRAYARDTIDFLRSIPAGPSDLE